LEEKQVYEIFQELQVAAEKIGEICKIQMGEYFQPNSDWIHIQGVTKEGLEFNLELIVRGVQNEPDRD
jgi:hypothetical protein